MLDTYLRLLHPVMPFVTEALWASLPHRASDPELLIVARWPGVGERDPLTEAEVGAVVDLVRGIRNARSEAHLEPAAWLETEVVVPVAMGATFEALRPAIERLARARPLERRLTREALTTRPGSLAVIAGELEAVVHPPTGTADPAAADLERARLERDLAEAEAWLAQARDRLAERGVHGQGATGGRGRRAGTRGRAGRAGGAPARSTGTLRRGRTEVFGLAPVPVARWPCYHGRRPSPVRGGRPCRSIS